MAWPYVRHLFSTAWRESKAELLSHLRLSVCAFVASLLLGTAGGAKTGGLIGAVIGGMGAPLVVAFLAFAWNLSTAPARIYREQEVAIESLRAERELRKLDVEGREPRAGGESAPVAEIRLIRRGEYGGHVLLEVVNSGCSGEFFAEITASGDVDWPTEMTYAAWSSHGEFRCRISEGARALIELAGLQFGYPIPEGGGFSSNQGAKWIFKDWWKPRDGIMYDVRIPTGPHSYTMYRSGGETYANRAFKVGKEELYRETIISLALYSDPPMLDGPRRVSVRFFGLDVSLVS